MFWVWDHYSNLYWKAIGPLRTVYCNSASEPVDNWYTWERLFWKYSWDHRRWTVKWDKCEIQSDHHRQNYITCALLEVSFSVLYKQLGSGEVCQSTHKASPIPHHKTVKRILQAFILMINIKRYNITSTWEHYKMLILQNSTWTSPFDFSRNRKRALGGCWCWSWAHQGCLPPFLPPIPVPGRKRGRDLGRSHSRSTGQGVLTVPRLRRMVGNSTDNQKRDYFTLLQQGPGKIASNISYKS